MTLIPEQAEHVRRVLRRWQETVAPCGISHVDIYNPCLPEEDGVRLLCITCWRHQQLALEAA